jgi:hypothetical protein
MNRGAKRLFVMLAALWAIFCGGFTYNVTQQEKLSLYREYVGRYTPERWEETKNIQSDAKIETQREIDRHAYNKALRELYWTFAPFLWISITIGGYIVVAGIFLPILS